MNKAVNILLVDDEARNLDVLESILQSSDYRLVRAQTTDEALLALINNDIAAMVLDVQMPQMTGFELANLIKQRKRSEHIPIIFLTAYFQDDKDVLEGYGVGAVDYLTKPVNPQILKSKLAAFVDLFHKTQALAEMNRALEQEILQRKAAEEALRLANIELEGRVGRRTADLTRVNSELAVSELRYRELIQALPAAVYTTNAEGRVLLYNQAAIDLWGRVPEIGKDLWCGSYKIYEPDGKPLPLEECPMAVTLRTGKPVRGREIIIERQDGTRRHVLPFPEPVWDNAHRLIGAVNMLMDITEQKSAEVAIRHLAAIVEFSGDAIISKDTNGIITSWNDGARHLFGYTSEEMIGRPLLTLIPADRRQEETEILTAIRQGRRIEHYETVRQCKDGRLIDISLTVSPIRDAAGKVIGASKIAHDITLRRQTEQALREARDELARTNEGLELRVQERTSELRETNGQLEEFVYSIAHDLRAPLRAMEACSQMLLDECGERLEDMGTEYARRINKSAQFMDKLLLDLLEYGRTARAQVELVAVEPAKAWEAAVFQCQHQIQQKQAVVEIKSSLPKVRAHEATLSQTLANFLSNGLRFVPKGVQPHICLCAEEKGSVVRLTVEDNGIGIAPEHHERIFRVFERLHGASYGGTGIGLAIARKGVERMNGRVGLESTLGSGSRFWIELPAAEETVSHGHRSVLPSERRVAVSEVA